MYNYSKIKKEVKRFVLGEDFGFWITGVAPFQFKIRYFDKIVDKEKRQLVQKALLEILSSKPSAFTKKIRSFAAYVASDIGLLEAKPFVENMLNEKRIMGSSLVYILERAAERFQIAHQLSDEEILRLIVGYLKGKYQSGHGGGNEYSSFKPHLYDKMSDPTKREAVKRVLFQILTEKRFFLRRKFVVEVAYVASMIGVEGIKPIIKKIAEDPKVAKNRFYAPLIQHALTMAK